MGFNSLVLVFYVPNFTFTTCYYIYIYKIFDQIYIDLFYHIRFKRLFDSGIWLSRAAQEVWRFTETDLGAISDPEHSARVNLVPLFSRFGPILRTFRPLLSQCSPIVRSFGPLDYFAVLFMRKQGRVSFDNYLFWRYFLFSIGAMLYAKVKSLVTKGNKTIEIWNSTEVVKQHVGCNFTKFQLKTSIVFWHVSNFPWVPVVLPLLL